jgi:hypothetical protein
MPSIFGSPDRVEHFHPHCPGARSIHVRLVRNSWFVVGSRAPRGGGVRSGRSAEPIVDLTPAELPGKRYPGSAAGGQPVPLRRPGALKQWPVEGSAMAVIGCGSLTALWIAMTLVARQELGWMAWVLGAFTGMGMARDPNGSARLRGLLAVAIAAGGMIAASLSTFLFVVGPILQQIDASRLLSGHLFVVTMLDPVDLVFLLLGLRAAYRQARSGL